VPRRPITIYKDANHWHRLLLRTRHKRPRRRATKPRDELPPSHRSFLKLLCG
jgi:hypothetical protein